MNAQRVARHAGLNVRWTTGGVALLLVALRG